MENEDILLRRMALEIVIMVNKQEEYSHIAIKGVLDKYDYLENNKKAFVKRLSSGTIENKLKLDYVIANYSKVKFNKIKPVVLAILELGVYQILFMDNVYDTKACNLMVDLAKKKGLSNLSGFINGVLRNVARNKESIIYPDRTKDLVEYLSIEYSMPKELVKLFLDQYGEVVTESILKSSVSDNDVYIRFCGSYKEKREDLIKAWESEGAEVELSDIIDYAAVVRKAGVSSLNGFDEGAFTVQDLSSMMIGYLAPIKEGDMVLDVCAAPGGKSTHIADRLNGTGQVIACDITDNKVDRIEENIDRLGLTNVSAMVADATIENKEWLGEANLVLADVPCSGLGVIGKKPDIKYRVKAEQLESIVSLQRSIIDNVVKYVSPDGYLMYSTCTINKAENEENVQYITDNYPFEVVPVSNVPDQLKQFVGEDGCLKTIQGLGKTDGFFIAILRKKA